MLSLIKKFFTLLFILILGCLAIWIIKPTKLIEKLIPSNQEINSEPKRIYKPTQPTLSKPVINPQSVKNNDWFAEKRWLTDAEIDWANKQIASDDKFKVLNSSIFHDAKLLSNEYFSELLNQITSFQGELIFIPVNQPNFHWSLLVYEVKSKTFYHYDTLRGANWDYTQTLCEELLGFLLESWQSSSYHLKTQHEIKQDNSWDCGIAVISLIKRISEQYRDNMENIDLGEFDFKKDRGELRDLYLKNKNF